ncbi:hypothetical protein V7201_14720 [Bacillus sp. JJ1122]
MEFYHLLDKVMIFADFVANAIIFVVIMKQNVVIVSGIGVIIGEIVVIIF